MFRYISFILISLLLILSGSCTNEKENCESVLILNKFEVGQVWKYDNRQGEDSSTFTILKIEKYHKVFDSINYTDTVIHIRIDKIKVHDPKTITGFSNFIEHLPCSVKTLSQSAITTISKRTTLPEFTNSYKRWKTLYNRGKNQYWGLSIKEAISYFDSLRTAK